MPSWSADAAAKPDATSSPIGVAMTKPSVRPSTNTPGVDSACSPRNPAADRKASETRNSRASPRWRAASPVAKASEALIEAAPSTSQKCAGCCSHWKSSRGAASSSHSPASGIASSTASSTGDAAAST